MKNTLLAALVISLISSLATGYTPNFDLMTDDELWDSSDYVGVVTIVKGQYVVSKGYILESKVEMTLKGSPVEKLTINAPFPQPDVPNHLGEMYLVGRLIN